MPPASAFSSEKSRLAVLLEHFSAIDDPRDVRRISHPLAEVLLLVVCGTVADCDEDDHIVRVQAQVERGGGKAREEVRFYISSAPLDAARAGHAVRSHWGIENPLHWALDVTSNEDQSRLRKGHGARNMAVVRHFALNRARTATDTKSIKLRRKMAG